MRSRPFAVVALALSLSLVAPAPARAEGGMMGFFSSLGAQVVKMARGIQSFFGGGAETTPAEATSAGHKFGREVGREVHGVAAALESTAKDLSDKGIDAGSLERELEALKPDLERLKALSEKARRESEATGAVSPETAREIEALQRSLEPKLEAIGDRVGKQVQEAIDTFKSKFSEEDIARMKRGVEKVGGFMKGFAEGFKDFMEAHGHELGASHER